MKLSVASLLVVALLVGCQGEPIGRTITNVIQGGQTLANMMLVTGARAVAPVADAFVQMIERFMAVGKRYMQHIDAMLAQMDVDPQMKLMAEAMHMNLYDLETALDGLLQNTLWGGEVVKATADCVVPQFEEVTKVKDSAMRAIGTVIQEQREALTQLASAGNSIGEQMQSLQDLQDKVTLMIANGQGLEAMQYVIKNRQKSEKDGRMMESTYFSALDEYREATGVSLKKMSDALGKVYEQGDKIMEKLDSCIEPRVLKMLKTELQQKKNKTGPRHVLPERLTFFHPTTMNQFNSPKHTTPSQKTLIPLIPTMPTTDVHVTKEAKQ